MKLRSILVILVAAALGATLVGCGGDADVAKPTGQSADNSNNSNNSDNSNNSGDSGDSGNSDDSSSGSIPSASDLAPLVGEDCAAVATAYTAALGMAFASPEEAERMQDELAKIKDKVPEGIAEDIATVNKAFKAIATEGIIKAGQMMESQEFEDASSRLEKFFEDGCGGS